MNSVETIKIDKKASKVKKKFSTLYLVIFVLLTLFALVFFAIMGWGLVGSFRGDDDFFGASQLLEPLPAEWTFNNYLNVFQSFKITFTVISGYSSSGVPVMVTNTADFLRLFLNTIIYALGGAFVITFCPCIVAYATAKFDKWITSKIIYWTVIITMMIPLVGTTAASISIAQKVGVYDSLWGNFIQKFNFLGVYFLIFYGSYKMLAKDYTEAAYLDGANEWQVFFRIIFPLVKNIFGTVLLIKFIEFWNDYNTVLVYLPSYPTLSYAVYAMTQNSANGGSIASKVTSAMVLFVPMVILFTIFQKRLLGNLSMGGVKE